MTSGNAGTGASAEAPRGVWLVARTPADRPYPCRCRPGKPCSPKWCPCAGRADLANVPPGCCAHRFGPDAVARAWRTPPAG